MSQKFINPKQKQQSSGGRPSEQNCNTDRKPDSGRKKHFCRKRSEESDRSIDSKRSRRSQTDSMQQAFINNQQEKLIRGACNNAKIQNNSTAKVHLNLDSTGELKFFQHLANSVTLNKDISDLPLGNRQRYCRNRTDRVNTFNDGRKSSQEQKRESVGGPTNHQPMRDYRTQLQTAVAELEVRSKQVEVMGSEIQILKQSIEGEKEKRRIAEKEKKTISNQLAQKAGLIQGLEIQNKKLIQEKQLLVKQIEFLEKINFDEKTRNNQSYREKSLSKENKQLKQQLQANKSLIERSLEDEIKRLNDEKYILKRDYETINLAFLTLKKQFEKFKLQEKNSVFQSEEYIKLREKYKLCLDAYKKLKIEYCELQKELNESLSHIPKHSMDSDSELSVVLSSSSSERSLEKSLQRSLLKLQGKKELTIDSFESPVRVIKDHIRQFEQRAQIDPQKEKENAHSPRSCLTRNQLIVCEASPQRSLSPRNKDDNVDLNTPTFKSPNHKNTFQASTKRKANTSPTACKSSFSPSSATDEKHSLRNEYEKNTFRKQKNVVATTEFVVAVSPLPQPQKVKPPNKSQKPRHSNFNEAYRMRIGLVKPNPSK